MFGSSEIAKLVASLPKYDVSVLDMRLALIELNSGKDITLFEANRILRVFGQTKALSTASIVSTFGKYSRGDNGDKAAMIFLAFDIDKTGKLTEGDVKAFFDNKHGKFKSLVLGKGVMKLGDPDKKGYITADDCK